MAFLSEKDVVNLLVETVHQRSRAGKPSTRVSALAGGLLQSDSKYGDLRSVLLKYGTLHQFLDHHREVFMLEVDKKGQAKCHDPIVRIKSNGATLTAVLH